MLFNCVSLISENQHQWNKCNQYLASGKFCRLLQSRFGDMVLHSKLHFPRTFFVLWKACWSTFIFMEYSLNFRLLQTNEPIYMKAYFRWTKMIQFCKKCKSNNKMFLGCFPTAFIDDPSLKKLNASRKGLRAHVVMIHRLSVQRSLHLQRNTYNHTNTRTYTLKNTVDQIFWFS